MLRVVRGCAISYAMGMARPRDEQMGWSALTNFDSVRIGTQIQIVESPSIPDHPYPLRAPAKVPLEFADNSRAQITVRKVESDRAEIEVQGRKWIMSHWRQGEHPISIRAAPGLYFQDWVIRSEVQSDADETTEGKA